MRAVFLFDKNNFYLVFLLGGGIKLRWSKNYSNKLAVNLRLIFNKSYGRI